MNSSFAALPPHFDQSNGNIMSVEEWELILPGYSSFYPVSFRKVCPFLLASLVHHMDWLKDNLSINHPLFISRVWTSGLLDRLKPLLQSGNISNPITKLCATGVPEYVQLSSDIESLKNRMTSFEGSMTIKIDDLPQKLKDVMFENLQINGAIPITASQVQDMINDLRNTLQSSISNAVNNQRNTENNNENNNMVSSTNSTTWAWKGRFHPVPEGYRFPKCSTKALWDLWWGGIPRERIGPLRQLKSFDFGQRSDITNLSKARKVMHVLCTGRTECIASLSISDRDNLFQHQYLKLFHDMYPNQSEEELDRRRIGDLQYMTVYDLISDKC